MTTNNQNLPTLRQKQPFPQVVPSRDEDLEQFLRENAGKAVSMDDLINWKNSKATIRNDGTFTTIDAVQYYSPRLNKWVFISGAGMPSQCRGEIVIPKDKEPYFRLNKNIDFEKELVQRNIKLPEGQDI